MVTSIQINEDLQEIDLARAEIKQGRSHFIAEVRKELLEKMSRRE